MDFMDIIECAYENMMIHSSIVVCDNPTEMAFIVNSLEEKSFPCRYASTFKKKPENMYHNVFVCTYYEFSQKELWENIEGFEINCLFFLGKDVFAKCLPIFQNNKTYLKPVKEHFIFTI